MGFTFGNTINAVRDTATRECLQKLGASVAEQGGTVSTLIRDGETVQSHASLTDLDYASSGHTGFAATTDIPVASSITPTSITLTASAVGTGTTWARDDHRHGLDVGIAPTWTAVHIYSSQDVHNAGVSLGTSGALISAKTTAPSMTITGAAANSGSAGSAVGIVLSNSNALGGNRSVVAIQNGGTDIWNVSASGAVGASTKRMDLTHDASTRFRVEVSTIGVVTMFAAGSAPALNANSAGSMNYTATTSMAFTANAGDMTFAGTSGNAFRFNTALSIVLADGMVISPASGHSTGTKIGGATTDKLGLWNKTPIIQPAGALQAAITNNTGGTQDGTLAALASVGTDLVAPASQADVNARMATINDNFTDIYALLNAMRTAMVDFGSMKGAA